MLKGTSSPSLFYDRKYTCISSKLLMYIRLISVEYFYGNFQWIYYKCFILCYIHLAFYQYWWWDSTIVIIFIKSDVCMCVYVLSDYIYCIIFLLLYLFFYCSHSIFIIRFIVIIFSFYRSSTIFVEFDTHILSSYVCYITYLFLFLNNKLSSEIVN